MLASAFRSAPMRPETILMEAMGGHLLRRDRGEADDVQDAR